MRSRLELIRSVARCSRAGWRCPARSVCKLDRQASAPKGSKHIGGHLLENPRELKGTRFELAKSGTKPYTPGPIGVCEPLPDRSPRVQVHASVPTYFISPGYAAFYFLICLLQCLTIRLAPPPPRPVPTITATSPLRERRRTPMLRPLFALGAPTTSLLSKRQVGALPSIAVHEVSG